MIRVINENRLLDGCQLKLRFMGETGANYMWHRLLCTRFPVSARWANIKHLAARLALEDEENLRDEKYTMYVKALCAVAAMGLDSGHATVAAVCLHSNDPMDSYESQQYEDRDYEYDLMSAAVYFNKLAIIEEKSNDPHCLRTILGTFGNPYRMAVMGGHHEAVDLLFSKVHKYDIEMQKSSVVGYACKQGSMELVRRVLPRWRKQGLEQKRSQLLPVLHGSLGTPSVEIFEMIMDIKRTTIFPTLNEIWRKRLLKSAVKERWLDMVQHLLENHAPTDTHEALVEACDCGHVEAVQQLLDYGTKMDGNEIAVAAHKGRWDVVRLLVERGADINGDWGEKLPDSGEVWGEVAPDDYGYKRYKRGILPIVGAVAFEREDVVREHVSLGARLDGNFGEKAVEKARTEGLDSMLALLRELGVEGVDDGKEREV